MFSCILFFLDDVVTSLDFDPNGERVATIDPSGACLISDIDTNSNSFHLDLGSGNLLYLLTIPDLLDFHLS